jgi:hypothetical protein
MVMAPENDSAPERRHSKVRRLVDWWRTAVSAKLWSGKVLVAGLKALERGLSAVRRCYRLLLFVGCIVLLAWYIPRRFPEWYLHIVAVLWGNLLLVSILLVVLLFSLLRWLLWKLPKRQVEGIPEDKDRLPVESGFRESLIQIVQTFVQILGGAALLGGLYFTAQTLRTSEETLRINQKTLETTQQGQITERFTRAIEQLGDKERLMVRLGGIYALERIARDSDSADHWVVMEVLTAFVREQTKESPHERKPRSDIQAILTVIGRRTRTFGNGEIHQLDLHNTNLQGAHLSGAKLQGAHLYRAQLQSTHLREVQLQDAHLRGAKLQDAHLDRAQLQGVDLTGVEGLTQDQIEMACLDEHTKLPKGLTPPAPCSPHP